MARLLSEGLRSKTDITLKQICFKKLQFYDIVRNWQENKRNSKVIKETSDFLLNEDVNEQDFLRDLGEIPSEFLIRFLFDIRFNEDPLLKCKHLYDSCKCCGDELLCDSGDKNNAEDCDDEDDYDNDYDNDYNFCESPTVEVNCSAKIGNEEDERNSSDDSVSTNGASDENYSDDDFSDSSVSLTFKEDNNDLFFFEYDSKFFLFIEGDSFSEKFLALQDCCKVGNLWNVNVSEFKMRVSKEEYLKKLSSVKIFVKGREAFDSRRYLDLTSISRDRLRKFVLESDTKSSFFYQHFHFDEWFSVLPFHMESLCTENYNSIFNDIEDKIEQGHHFFLTSQMSFFGKRSPLKIVQDLLSSKDPALRYTLIACVREKYIQGQTRRSLFKITSNLHQDIKNGEIITIEGLKKEDFFRSSFAKRNSLGESIAEIVRSLFLSSQSLFIVLNDGQDNVGKTENEMKWYAEKTKFRSDFSDYGSSTRMDKISIIDFNIDNAFDFVQISRGYERRGENSLMFKFLKCENVHCKFMNK